jgi:hypothetical protein
LLTGSITAVAALGMLFVRPIRLNFETVALLLNRTALMFSASGSVKNPDETSFDPQRCLVTLSGTIVSDPSSSRFG